MIIPLSAVKNEEFNYLLHYLKKNNDDFKSTIIDLNTNEHYGLKNVEDFINKFYEVKQFIDNRCLVNSHRNFERQLNLIDEVYRSRINED